MTRINIAIDHPGVSIGISAFFVRTAQSHVVKESRFVLHLSNLKKKSSKRHDRKSIRPGRTLLRSVPIAAVNTVELAHQSLEFDNTLAVRMGGLKAVKVGSRLCGQCLWQEV
jgi:hypothetical protein